MLFLEALRMIEFKKMNLLDITPPNLLQDEKVKNITQIASGNLQKLTEKVYKLDYTQLSDLPEEVIDHLLWENHIGYDEGLVLAGTLEKKIALLQSAIELHQIKGTPGAIELVCELLDVRTTLLEWFEYGGDPYCFKVEIMEVTNEGLTEEKMALLEKLVMHYKNERSHLDAINIYLTSRNKTYFGSTHTTGEEITIYPHVVDAVEISGTYHVASAHTEVDSTTIYPKGGNIQ